MGKLADKIRQALIMGLNNPAFMKKLRSNPVSALKSVGLGLTAKEREVLIRLLGELQNTRFGDMKTFLKNNKLLPLKDILDWAEFPWARKKPF